MVTSREQQMLYNQLLRAQQNQERDTDITVYRHGIPFSDQKYDVFIQNCQRSSGGFSASAQYIERKSSTSLPTLVYSIYFMFVYFITSIRVVFFRAKQPLIVVT